MKLISLTTKGLVPLPAEQTLRFPDLPKVAVIGENGAGKTTLLDCIPIALFGFAPNRPKSVYDVFRGNDALVDLEFEMKGHTYRVKRLIDATGRKQKPYLYCDGQPLTEGKTAEFEVAMAEHLGLSETAFMASVYHAQNGRGNPLSLDDKGRRELLSEVLGLNRFDQPHALASDAYGIQDREIEKLEAQKQTLLNGLGTEVSTLEAQKQELTLRVETLGNAIYRLESDAQACRDRLATARANAQNGTELQRQLDDVVKLIAADKAEIAELEKKLEKNQDELLSKRDEIVAAVAEDEILAETIQRLTQERDDLQAEMNRLDGEHKLALQEDWKVLEDIRLDRDEKAKAIQQVEQQRNQLQNTILGLQRGSDSVREIASTLEVVPCKTVPDLHSTCPLLAKARESKDGLEANEKQIAELEKQAAGLPDSREDREQLDAIEARLTEAQKAYQAKQQQTPSADKRPSLDKISQDLTAEQTRKNALKPLVDNYPYLQGAEDRVQVYKTGIKSLTDRVESNETAQRDLQKRVEDAANLTTVVTEAEAELSRIETSKREAEANKQAAAQSIGQLESQIEQAQKTKSQSEEVATQIREKSQRLAMLSVLREGLGPKGARALKIDSAGPEISELVNALLRECYGSKFTIIINTLREQQNGKEKESLDFAIIDNETGEQSLVENKSGGEQALIKEVISLGLCIYQRRRTGVDTRTLIRDEATAPLSENNTVLYLQMLDKALEIGGFDQVLYVSHKGCAQQMADAVIAIADGRAEVREG